MKKNNKKGFTLVELLGVIAILALLATVATPAIISLSNKIKGNMYEAKVKMIKETVILYAEKRGDIPNDPNGATYKLNVLCGESHVSGNNSSLYKNYMLSPDEGLTTTECLVNPVKNEKMGSACYFKITKNAGGRYIIDFPVDSFGETTEIDEACKGN